MKLMTAFPFIVSLGVMLLVQQAFTNLVPSFLTPVRSSTAPKLTELPLREARNQVRSLGFELEVGSALPSADLPKDTVIDQQPAPGARLQQGDVIRVSVSAGLQPPNLIGKTVEQARAELMLEGWQAAPELELRPAGGPPNVVIDQRPGPNEAVAAKGRVTLIVAAPNPAFGRPVLTNSGAGAPEVVDGQADTMAWAPSNPPHWIEVDFGEPVTFNSVSLLPAVDGPAMAMLELWAWDSGNRFYPLHGQPQQLNDGDDFEVRLPQRATNVVRLRVVTSAAPGRVGWRELSVADR